MHLALCHKQIIQPTSDNLRLEVLTKRYATTNFNRTTQVENGQENLETGENVFSPLVGVADDVISKV